MRTNAQNIRMFKSVVVFSFLSFVSGAFVPNLLDERIVGGRNTSIEEVPYQVAIETDDGEQFCGGSIIATRHILTAGHCFIDKDETKTSIRTGSSLRGIGGTVIKASKVITHPKYNVSTFDYDAVVIELEEDIELSETSQIVGLADLEPTEGTEGLISGWGRLELAGQPSDVLQSLTVPVADHQICVDSYASGDTPVTNRMICIEKGRNGFCKGDSGGPLVVETNSGNRVVAGIDSWSGADGCTSPRFYNVLVNVADPEIRGFILEQAGV